MQTRRQFGKTILGAAPTVALAGGLGITTMGLSCGSIWSDIENYVPIGIEAFDEVLSLLDPTLLTAISGIIKDVQAGFTALIGAITNYENAPASTKTTLVGKITTAINALISALQSFWSATNLPDGSLAQTIEGVLQLIISTLAAFLPLIGGVLLATKKLARVIPIIPRTKAQLKQTQFKKDCGTIFTSHGYPNQVY
jgi:hypothetical protein